jgi:hypothetical protein
MAGPARILVDDSVRTPCLLLMVYGHAFVEERR